MKTQDAEKVLGCIISFNGDDATLDFKDYSITVKIGQQFVYKYDFVTIFRDRVILEEWTKINAMPR